MALVAVLALLALVGAACGGGGGSSSEGNDATGTTGGGSTETGGWTFEDDAGVTHHLDVVPKTIVAETTAAGGLWEYGIVARGVFGPLTLEDGSTDSSLGRADADDFTSVGESSTEVNVEAILAMDPDIIITPMWDEDDYWGIPDNVVERLEKIAPIVGIRVDDRAIDEPLDRFAELAESLGADEAKVAAARKEFDTASDEMTASVKANPDVTFIAASGVPAELYIAHPPGFADLRYLQELGLDLVVPESHADGGGFWETISWEETGKYPADVVMADARGVTMDEIEESMPAPAKELPAVKAGQIMPWPASMAFGYGNVADYLNDVRAMLEKADPDTA